MMDDDNDGATPSTDPIKLNQTLDKMAAPPTTRSDVVRDFSNFVDANMRLIKAGLYAAAGVTLIFVYRRLHLGTKFSRADDIPVEYFDRNVKLRGRLVGRGGDSGSHLLVDHRPALRLYGRDDVTPLTVELAGLKLTPSGSSWIDANFLNRNIWFRLIEHNPSYTETVPAIVLARAKYRVIRQNVNLSLVRKGFAQVDHSCVERLSHSFLFNDLVKEMEKAEQKARRGGRGDWETPSLWQRTKRMFGR